MTKLEVFMLFELINKATFLVNEESGVPMDWFDEVVDQCSELTEKEKHFLKFGEGSSIGVKI
jgi:hypothetical protein